MAVLVLSILQQPIVLLPVGALCFAFGYRTRDYLAALLPAFLAALCAAALWHHTGDRDIGAATVTALWLGVPGVMASLLGAALARERMGTRPRPEWLGRTVTVVLAGGGTAGSKVRASVACLAFAAVTDGLWINKALYEDDPPAVATGLLLYAGLPALVVAAVVRGQPRSRIACAALYLACMVLVFLIWIIGVFASCGDACR